MTVYLAGEVSSADCGDDACFGLQRHWSSTEDVRHFAPGAG